MKTKRPSSGTHQVGIEDINPGVKLAPIMVPTIAVIGTRSLSEDRKRSLKIEPKRQANNEPSIQGSGVPRR